MDWSPLIECSGLWVAYRDILVIRDLNLRWAKNDGPLGLTGPNGSGKTTFIKACLGLLRPDAGELRLLGTDTRSRSLRTTLSRVGWTPQQRAPGGLRISVRDLVSMGRGAALRPFRRHADAEPKAAEEAMELCGVAHLADQAVQELSGGQYQRAAIARALASKPCVLLLDEPTTFLDTEGRASVVGLLRTLADDGRTSLAFVSHDPALLELSGRQLHFKDGELAAC